MKLFKVGLEIWTKFIETSEPLQKTKGIVQETGIRSLNLTSVGTVIAIMYYERITGDTISLDGWIR